jgi:hypothetical protein
MAAEVRPMRRAGSADRRTPGLTYSSPAKKVLADGERYQQEHKRADG